MTLRTDVIKHARLHGLQVSGSEKSMIIVKDRQGHWSESWSLWAETWAEAHAALKRIEDAHIAGERRPWEAARPGYRGVMKPLAA